MILYDHKPNLLSVSRQVEPVRIPDIRAITNSSVRHNFFCSSSLQTYSQEKPGNWSGNRVLD